MIFRYYPQIHFYIHFWKLNSRKKFPWHQKISFSKAENLRDINPKFDSIRSDDNSFLDCSFLESFKILNRFFTGKNVHFFHAIFWKETEFKIQIWFKRGLGGDTTGRDLFIRPLLNLVQEFWKKKIVFDLYDTMSVKNFYFLVAYLRVIFFKKSLNQTRSKTLEIKSKNLASFRKLLGTFSRHSS